MKVITFSRNRSSSMSGFSWTAALTTTILCLGVVFGVFFADRLGSTCIDRPLLMILGFFGESKNSLNDCVLSKHGLILRVRTSNRPVDCVRDVRQVHVTTHAVTGRRISAGRFALLTILRVPRPRALGHRLTSLQLRIFRARLGSVGLRALFGAHVCESVNYARQRTTAEHNRTGIFGVLLISARF